MFLLELATLAFLTEKYSRLFDESLAGDGSGARAYLRVWAVLDTSSNLSQALITLRPDVQTKQSLTGQAFLEIWHALQEVA